MFALSLVLLVTTAAPGLSALNFKGYDWNTKAEKKVFSACDWVRSQLGQVERGLLPSQDDAILRPLRGLRRGRADKRDEQDHTQILFLLSYSEKWTVRTSPRPVHRWWRYSTVSASRLSGFEIPRSGRGTQRSISSYP